jgi:hypothetical protein
VPDSLERELQLDTTSSLAQNIQVDTPVVSGYAVAVSSCTASATSVERYIGDLFAVAENSVPAYLSYPRRRRHAQHAHHAVAHHAVAQRRINVAIGRRATHASSQRSQQPPRNTRNASHRHDSQTVVRITRATLAASGEQERKRH